MQHGLIVPITGNTQRNCSATTRLYDFALRYACLMGKPVFALIAVLLLAALVFFRLESDSGPREFKKCKLAVEQAKSWTVVSTSQPESQNYSTSTTRTKVRCPDDYEYLWRNRTRDDVITEQATIHTGGAFYVESVDGKWAQNANAGNPQIPLECGKGPALAQQVLGNAIIELPRRRAGKLLKGQRQTIEGVSCQDWSIDFGNEWPQIQGYTICIERKTHLPRRIQYDSPGPTVDFTGWNSTTVEPPSL